MTHATRPYMAENPLLRPFCNHRILKGDSLNRIRHFVGASAIVVEMRSKDQRSRSWSKVLSSFSCCLIAPIFQTNCH